MKLIKGKCKLSLSKPSITQWKCVLCLTKRHAMKTYGGVEVSLHAFLISAQDRGEWLASLPGERAHRTH